MRTNADTSTTEGAAKINSEQLEYGEPLFNENDDTLQIGKSVTTDTTTLKIFQAIPRALKNLFVFIKNKNSSNNFITLQDINGSEIFFKTKDWGTFTVPSSATWYNVASDGKKGSTVISDTTTFPRCQVISVPNMDSDKVVNVELSPSTSARTSVSQMKIEKKNFGFISPGSYSDTNSLILIFSKLPTANFNIRVTGG